MTKKSFKVADMTSLLGRIDEKRAELPKAEIQHVQPVSETPAPAAELSPADSAKPDERITGKTESRSVVEKSAPTAIYRTNTTGRPSIKRADIEYVKLSPRIPKRVKKLAEYALIEERYVGELGNPITTMDELIELALVRLLEEK